MTTKKPKILELKVSIVVPSYNQGKYIKETIDSILEQDYRPIEILVMDGGSSDETVDVLESYGDIPELNWVSQPDNGVVDAVNKGFSAATGEIVGIQCSDDVYMPGAFRKIIKNFMCYPDMNLIFGNAEYIGEDSVAFGRSFIAEYSLNNFLSRRVSIFQSSAFFRRRFLCENAGWKQEYSYVADNELWLRICMSGGVKRINDVLSRYRYHSNQRDVEKKKIMNDWKSMIADSEDVQELPYLSRSAAKCGVYRTYLSCIEESKWAIRSWYSYMALFHYPEIYPVIDKRDLKPGYRPVRNLLSKMKQKLQSVTTLNSKI